MARLNKETVEDIISEVRTVLENSYDAVDDVLTVARLDEVRVGDTLVYKPDRNKKTGLGGVVVVVGSDGYNIELSDDSSKTVNDILGDPDWVLLGRVYRPGDEKGV